MGFEFTRQAEKIAKQNEKNENIMERIKHQCSY